MAACGAIMAATFVDTSITSSVSIVDVEVSVELFGDLEKGESWVWRLVEPTVTFEVFSSMDITTGSGFSDIFSDS